jgi:hypothetical protein
VERLKFHCYIWIIIFVVASELATPTNLSSNSHVPTAELKFDNSTGHQDSRRGQNRLDRTRHSPSLFPYLIKLKIIKLATALPNTKFRDEQS